MAEGGTVGHLMPGDMAVVSSRHLQHQHLEVWRDTSPTSFAVVGHLRESSIAVCVAPEDDFWLVVADGVVGYCVGQLMERVE